MLRRLISAAILLSALSLSVAWADNDDDDSGSVIPHKEKAKAEEPREVSAGGAHRKGEAQADSKDTSAASEDHLGSFFGVGDDYRMIGADESGNPVFSDQAGPTTGKADQAPSRGDSQRDMPQDFAPQGNSPRDSSPRDNSSRSDIIFPHGNGDDNYSNENVYGPMWGVPKDAVGLDGFSGNPYPGEIDDTAKGNAGTRSQGDADEKPSRHQGKAKQEKQQDDSDQSSSGDGDNVQRNHHINRSDPNDW